MTIKTLDDEASFDSPPAASQQQGVSVIALGPSDSSDSGADRTAISSASDQPLASMSRGGRVGDTDVEDVFTRDEPIQPVLLDDKDMTTDTDTAGTGERSSADSFPGIALNQDIGFDRIVSSQEAGLGDGLDQAEEAILGITDEELFEGNDDWP